MKPSEIWSLLPRCTHCFVKQAFMVYHKAVSLCFKECVWRNIFLHKRWKESPVSESFVEKQMYFPNFPSSSGIMSFIYLLPRFKTSSCGFGPGNTLLNAVACSYQMQGLPNHGPRTLEVAFLRKSTQPPSWFLFRSKSKYLYATRGWITNLCSLMLSKKGGWYMLQCAQFPKFDS